MSTPRPALYLVTTTFYPGDYSAECDCAVIALTPTVLTLLEHRATAFQTIATPGGPLKGDPPAQMDWYDGMAKFCSNDLFTELEWEDGEEGYRFFLTLPKHWERTIQRLDMSRCSLDATDVWWTARPKHTELTVETPMIPLARLRELDIQLAIHATPPPA